MENLLFTSAGNNTRFYNNWIDKNNNYDIYLIYYGDSDEKYDFYKEKVKFIEKRKGSKFQNFHYFYNKYPEIINQYKYFFIIDDDIEFNSNDINKMFYYAKKYDLLICQPSFDHKSKISHPITKYNEKILLAYTNFVEVNVPLFKKEALDKLMKVYNPILIGWGIDYLALQANGKHLKDKYAVIHDIKCINPREENKIIKNRELNLLPNVHNREEIWRNFAKQNNYNNAYNHHSYLNILIENNDINQINPINNNSINNNQIDNYKINNCQISNCQINDCQINDCQINDCQINNNEKINDEIKINNNEKINDEIKINNNKTNNGENKLYF